MTTEERTCEQRLPEHLNGRMDTIKALVRATEVDGLKDMSDDELGEITGYSAPTREEFTDSSLIEYAYERMYEMPLSVTTKRLVEVLISTGGPEDAFVATVDDDGTIERIEYVFKDWFDGARVSLEGEQFDAAEAFIRHVAMIDG